MKTFLVFFFLFLSYPAFAEVRISIDTTGWTTKQISLMEAVAYKIAFSNGENIVPTKDKNGVLIFADLSQLTANKIKQTLLTEINLDMIQSETRRQAEVAKEENLRNNAKNKLKALGLTDEEIQTFKMGDL